MENLLSWGSSIVRHPRLRVAYRSRLRESNPLDRWKRKIARPVTCFTVSVRRCSATLARRQSVSGTSTETSLAGVEKLGFQKLGVAFNAATRCLDGTKLDRHEYILTSPDVLPELDV
jgi:hypothetical protein